MSKYVLPTSRTESSRTNSMMLDNISDTAIEDESGYSVTPLTDHLVLKFHLDIPTKQWPKVSRTFLKALNGLIGLKRRDYNLMTVCKHEKARVESRLSILVRKFNKKWPPY
eukprot:275822_1